MLLDGWSVDERVGASPDHYAHHRTVKDTTGAALPGVTLVVVNQDSGLPARSWPNACFRRRQKNRKRWGRRRRRAKCVYLARSLRPNLRTPTTDLCGLHTRTPEGPILSSRLTSAIPMTRRPSVFCIPRAGA